MYPADVGATEPGLALAVERLLDVPVQVLDAVVVEEQAEDLEGAAREAAHLEELPPLQTLRDERFEISTHATKKLQQRLKQ